LGRDCRTRTKPRMGRREEHTGTPGTTDGPRETGATLGAGWGGRPSYRRARPITPEPLFFPNTGSEKRWSGKPASREHEQARQRCGAGTWRKNGPFLLLFQPSRGERPIASYLAQPVDPQIPIVNL